MKKTISIIFLLILSIVKSQGFAQFTSAGSQDQYVPVVFQVLLTEGTKSINISRYSIHTNREWLAQGIATINAVGNGYGSGANSISLDNFTAGNELPTNGSKVISFVGRVVADSGTSNIIVFLRGGTTYYTDGSIVSNTGYYQDPSGFHNLTPVSINDPLYNLPKGKYYSNFDITAKTTDFVTSSSGNVGIGISKPQNKLDVNGTVHAKEVNISLVGWPDFVFKNNYQLQTLEDVEKHIKEKGHLPNVPSEQDVLENGVNLGDNQKILLQKIEELTLYSIEQNKQLQTLRAENIQMRSILQRLDKLEQQQTK